MVVYTLHKKQKLPITKKKAWEFLSNPANLKVITPKEMNFDIISKIDREIYAGQIIQHQVTPMMGIKTTWVSKIVHVEKYKYFVDEQLQGPYAFWSHKHFVNEIENGVEMEDIIDYKVPLGFIGKLAHPLLVKPKLEEIFNYRQQKLIEIFGEYNG
ncbi:MAG: SRPBCC family protein [Flavobacteriaceae bacterium]|nr:SRPBCC family protein [Flavobacteriaceae bacterium]